MINQVSRFREKGLITVEVTNNGIFCVIQC